MLAARLRADDQYSLEMTAVDGSVVTIAKGNQPAAAVCFLGTECPLARLYAPRLSQLFSDFSKQRVQIIGVISNRQDTVAEIRDYVDQYNVTFPVIHDKDNRIADRFGASRTPEVFLLDSDLQLRYHGRIDDQYEPGVSRKAPERHDLRIAVQQVLAGQDVSIAETRSVGCIIGRLNRPLGTKLVNNDVTFSNQVSRVIRKHCLECHRAGEIAPFSMEKYDDVVGWADTMLETIDDGRMPPWNADPDVGHFANARTMSLEDRQVLRDWIAGGLKQGDPEDLPPPASFVSGWQLPREPDVVLPMSSRPFIVPADGTVEYQYFVVDPGFEEDQWVTGAQIIPGEASVVHHAIGIYPTT